MIGIDLGSRTVKIVQMKDNEIIKSEVYDTIQFYRRYAGKGERNLKVDVQELGFVEDKIIATGYGKVTIQIDGAEHIPEIQAHVKGAIWQTGFSDFTLIDIGGQDTKVIKIRDKKAVDFMTNDRCAASSGRYMENMAWVLDISLEELSSYSENPVELSSTCAIFGETEIIGKIVEGYSTAQLAAGVNYALYRRFASYLKKLGSDILVFSGGGAYNSALLDIVRRETKVHVERLFYPQINGAIGCCVYGDEKSCG
ncbi:acyl-CoA dehydratase activase [Thermosyntropha sp.]|uniref:acyl-CoA dehydratase activase n=1 Tax=Thermosyntropha sp. TaxID=2740820 RepID=UPI0025E76FCE|nr:acyl-CoA dehydratase activase [Thermosyntropha sp.]MBO8159842.1 2-hydroxyglutaryl-CoA dehydratase [Thermosyntropha sp.]